MKAYYYSDDKDEIKSLRKHKVLQPNSRYAINSDYDGDMPWPKLVIATTDEDYTKYVSGKTCTAFVVNIDSIANKLIPPHPGFLQLLQAGEKHNIPLDKLYWTTKWVKINKVLDIGEG